ncbi:Dual specificity testis-specific protein kinase 2 [Merluccius polli]|uniref:Dual specificity testis-specific protein kinase 2 n=1 Tax=Merluccius polli TaxID=89951 RepID=A0AA47NWH2_MERPO|nr:Dual specificity testis-specific protein kinase 2 [Merluccius polli]
MGPQLRVSSFRFLGINISEDLSWSHHTGIIVKAARQRLFFLLRLSSAWTPGYSAASTDAPSRVTCITAWYGSCTALDCNILQKVDLYTQTCRRKAQSILRDRSYPSHKLFTLLPSGKRYQSIHTQTTRFRDSFFSQTTRLLNSNCLVRCDSGVFTAVVGDFGLAEKIPDYSDGVEKQPLAIVGSPYWMAPEVLRGEFYDEKVDVFAYGIILCEIIARIEADPDFLPRTEDFGLDVESFENLIGDCPPAFFILAVTCCNMSAVRRPAFSDVVLTLEEMEKEAEESNNPITLGPVAVEVSPDRRCSSSCHPVDHQHQQQRQQQRRLARSQSDALPPVTLTPSHTTAAPLGTPGRVNPFSTRQDLNGGHCKLLDTPSKSVISLTFALPAPPHHPSPLSPHAHHQGAGRRRAPPRRCQSLPCTPELGRMAAGSWWNDEDMSKEGLEVKAVVPQDGVMNGSLLGEALGGRSVVEEQRDQRLTAKEEEGGVVEVSTEDSGLPLETLSLERLEEETEEEEACLTEAMDCTKSPEPEGRALASTPTRPLLTSASYCTLQTNGWPLPISNGPPSLPPLPRIDNNNGSSPVHPIGRQVRWGGLGAGWGMNGYAMPPPTEQDQGVSCPSCCMVGLTLPSACLGSSAAPPSGPWTGSLLSRRRPRCNLNRTPTASSPAKPLCSSSSTSATRTPLCRGANGLGSATLAPREPGLSLPEAQT